MECQAKAMSSVSLGAATRIALNLKMLVAHFHELELYWTELSHKQLGVQPLGEFIQIRNSSTLA